MKYPYILFALCLSSCQTKVINLNDDFDILKSSHSFSVLEKIENCDQMEGGCVANGKIYYSLKNADKGDYDNPESYIVEYSLKGKLLRKSGELHYGHGNYFTYIPEMNALAIAHADKSKLMSFVSLDTLEVIESRPIKDLTHYRALEYLGDNNYVFASGNMCYVARYTDKFEITNSFEFNFNYDDGITQGLCSFDSYVYDLRDNKELKGDNYLLKQNIQTSEFVKKIIIKGIRGEIEWISNYQDGFYIGTANPFKIYYLKPYL